jgi:hypothetical protein
MISEYDKGWIDGADYETLLRRWRFAKAGEDSIFQGEIGQYYKTVMFRKRDELGVELAAQASKNVGWER